MEASIDNSPFSLNIQTHMGPGLLFFGQHCNLKKMTIFFFNEDLSLRKIELEFFFFQLTCAAGFKGLRTIRISF